MLTKFKFLFTEKELNNCNFWHQPKKIEWHISQMAKLDGTIARLTISTIVHQSYVNGNLEERYIP
jgi:hypothetical protein